MKLKLLEPLRELFKDEVRRVGGALGLPREVVWRQPFPGPGLGVRVVGPITPENLEILRAADAILQEEMMASGWYWKVWQSFCVFLPVKSVGRRRRRAQLRLRDRHPRSWRASTR